MLLLTPQLAEQRPCSHQNHTATQELRVLYCARIQLVTEGRDFSWGSVKEQGALGLLFPVLILKVHVDVGGGKGNMHTSLFGAGCDFLVV